MGAALCSSPAKPLQEATSHVQTAGADELAQAERLLVAQSQAESFPEEKKALNDGKAIGAASRLVQLHPVLDDGGLIQAKGRVFKAEALDQEARQPVILDNRHPFTALVIQQLHADGGHHGQECLINELRQRYWVLKTRSTVRKVTQACQVCKIQRAKPKAPEMAALPECRLTPYVRPFTFTGMDYFGPMTVTVGRRHEKRYGVLFTCMTTRAVHLEIAASLTTDSAISAVRRLIPRRGKPKEIFSDNCINFRGADAELRRALQVDADKLGGELAGRAITWQFNPPAAPHMGGAWERLVRSMKVALRSQLKDTAPKEEVLHTFLCKAEAMVNSMQAVDSCFYRCGRRRRTNALPLLDWYIQRRGSRRPWCFYTHRRYHEKAVADIATDGRQILEEMATGIFSNADSPNQVVPICRTSPSERRGYDRRPFASK